MPSLRLPLIAAVAVLILAASPMSGSVTPSGYGPLRLGMTIEQIAAVAPGPVRAGVGDDPRECEEYMFGEDAGLILMTNDEKLVRFSIYEPGIATTKGIQVGDDVSRIHAAYGRKVIREPAPYAEEPAHDLYVWTSRGRGLRFEIDAGGKVVVIHAGARAIRLIEGCL